MKQSVGELMDAVLRDEVKLVSGVWNQSRAAELFGVSRSQPSAWKDGRERPGPQAARKISDLAAVVKRAMLVWTPEAAVRWLESPNAELHGAVPVDVVGLPGGATRVLGALDVEERRAWG